MEGGGGITPLPVQRPGTLSLIYETSISIRFINNLSSLIYYLFKVISPPRLNLQHLNYMCIVYAEKY